MKKLFKWKCPNCARERETDYLINPLCVCGYTMENISEQKSFKDET